MRRVLSTKILNSSQRNQVQSMGFDLVEYNAISTQRLKSAEQYQNFYSENAIVTSQRSVQLIEDLNIRIKKAFCVGEKTKNQLEKLGVEIVKVASYGKDLAELIVQDYKDFSFDFFCGEQRRDSIPDTLAANKINFQEHHLYQTKSQLRKFTTGFDVILFFSPSAVNSFFELNEPEKAQLICIGTSTASAAEKYSKSILIAKETSIESCIDELTNV